MADKKKGGAKAAPAPVAAPAAAPAHAASTSKTLGIMLVIACIGVPVVIAYTVSIYWIFRGKVKLDRVSY